MYRSTRLYHVVADDSSLTQPVFGPREMSAYQTKDLEVFSTTVRVGPSDAETTIAIAPVTTGYSIVLMSDYPVRVRLNGAAATQFTLLSNNVAATNVGAPLPDQCYLAMTGTVTELRLQPIASAASTANVKVVITGDPNSSYT